MIERKEILRWCMLIAIIFAIIMQIKVVKLILDNKEQMESDPFAYAARKFNLQETCLCHISEERTLVFNQTGSWTRISTRSNSIKDYTRIINISELQTN